jgi:hypothetical protein
MLNISIQYRSEVSAFYLLGIRLGEPTDLMRERNLLRGKGVQIHSFLDRLGYY